MLRNSLVTLAALALALSAFGQAKNKADPSEPQPDTTIVYKTTAEKKLSLFVFNPSGHDKNAKAPAIVFFHGGGWAHGNPSQFYPQARYLADRGMVAISASYRLAGKGDADPRTCVTDAKSAMRYVRAHAAELGIDPNRIAAGGGSAGGHLAAATALLSEFDDPKDNTSVSCHPEALVLFNPVFDNGPKGYGYERVQNYWKSFSPIRHIDSQAPPTLVMLGTEDELVPVKTARNYQKKMRKAGARCELKLYEGQPHGFFNSKNPENYRDTVATMDAFLVSLGFLKPTS